MAFGDLVSDGGHLLNNHRPVQPLKGRKVLQSQGHAPHVFWIANTILIPTAWVMEGRGTLTRTCWENTLQYIEEVLISELTGVGVTQIKECLAFAAMRKGWIVTVTCRLWHSVIVTFQQRNTIRRATYSWNQNKMRRHAFNTYRRSSQSFLQSYLFARSANPEIPQGEIPKVYVAEVFTKH